MHIAKLLLSYILTFLVFLLIDMLWLGIISKNLYQKYLGRFITSDINWIAAFVFYFIFVTGILYFAIYPALSNNSLNIAILNGILFGFFAYATYDLTNLATIKDWPVTIVIIDMVWGSFLSFIVSISGYYIFKWIT